MTDTTQGDLFPQLDISIRPWANPDSGDAGDALTRAGTADWTSDPRQIQAYQFFRSRGWTPAQAAGIVGGLRGETEGLNASQVHDNGIGLGIAGWNGQRLASLKAFAQANGTAPTDLQTQLAFLDHELRTSEKSAGQALAEAQDPADAGRAMLRYFRPSGWDSPGAHPERARYASQFAQGLGLSTADNGSAASAAASSAAGPSPDNLLSQLPQSKQASVAAQLLGLNGTERYQLWPERLAREALSAPHQALTSGFVPGSSDEIAAANAIANFAGGGAFPFAQRGAIGALGGRLTQVRGPAELTAGATAPVFHSTAGQVLENAGFSRASPAQWLAYLRNAQGVKGEELEWTGLADRLGNATEPQLTKADLLQHLADNQVDLNEIPKQEFKQWTANDSARLDDLERRRNDLTDAEEAEFQNLVSRENAVSDDQTGRPPDLPKYSSYVLPGAEPGSYREALLQLPFPDKPRISTLAHAQQNAARNGHNWFGLPIEEQANYIRGAEMSLKRGDLYHSSHWNEPNVLGHVRMNDRAVQVPGSDKPLSALFLEELQSDWHQQGRREGYKTAEPLSNREREEYMNLRDKTDRTNAENLRLYDLENRRQGAASGGVPNAPFKTSWPELLLKRMIREAAESGKDALAWTSGETQAARYDLSKQVEKLEISRGQNGKYEIYGTPKGERYPVKLGDAVAEEKLADYVGKDLANKAVEDLKGDKPAGRAYSGLDLRVGGEGMLKFYDDMLPKVAQKIVKKYGGKVELGETKTPIQDRFDYTGPDHTVGDLEFIKRSKNLTSLEERQLNDVIRHMGDNSPESYRNAIKQYGSPGLAEKLGGELTAPESAVPVHVLRLTPELRKAALSQGFPLFQSGVPLSIAGQGGRVHTLTPVSHDPFADQNILKGNAT